MKLLEALRPTLALVSSSAPRADRAGLRAALAARVNKQREVAEARETHDRRQTVLTAADAAARQAADATHRAKEARQRWVRNGCLSAVPEHHDLEGAAAEAVRAAQSAAADADAVSRELVRARDAVDCAQSDLRSCESAISAAIGEIIATEEAPLLERYADAATELRALRVQLMALQRVVDPWQQHPDAAPSSEGARLVDAALKRGLIVPWDAERESTRVREWQEEPGRDEPRAMFEQFVAGWRDRASKLRVDPES
jgi:hypothetical protein